MCSGSVQGKPRVNNATDPNVSPYLDVGHRCLSSGIPANWFILIFLTTEKQTFTITALI